MATSSRGTGWMALAIGLSFTLATVIFLAVEPRMGFETLDDFWDPVRVVPALASSVWLIGDLLHLLHGTLLIGLSQGLSSDRGWARALIRGTGMAAGSGFVLLAMVDRAASRLPALDLDPDALATLAVGVVATRMGLLYAALYLLGLFVLLVAWTSPRSAWFRALGTITGIAAIAFFVLPAPIPLLIAIWAYGLGFSLLRAPSTD